MHSSRSSGVTSFSDIKKTLMKAITHDEQQQHRTALTYYFQCMQQVSEFVQAELLKGPPNQQHPLSEQSHQLLKYSEQCMERITSLATPLFQSSSGGSSNSGGNPTNGSGGQCIGFANHNHNSNNTTPLAQSNTNTTSSGTNHSSSSKPTPTKTNVTSHAGNVTNSSPVVNTNLTKRNSFNSQSSATTPNNPTPPPQPKLLTGAFPSKSSSSSAIPQRNINKDSTTSNIPNSASQQSPLNATSSQPKISSSTSSSAPSTTTGSMDSKKTLQMKRKEYEKAQIVQMKEQMIKMSQERARQMEIQNNVNNFLQRIQNKKRTFRWKEQDAWSKFVDTNFNYQNMSQLLIEQDRVFLDNLSNPSLLKPIEAVRFGGVDDEDASTVDPTTENTIKSHCMNILSNPSHTLSQVIVKFSEYFGDMYNNAQYTSNGGDHETRNLISKCVNDIELFVEKLSMVLFGKYWELPSHKYEEIVIDCIMETLWGNGIFSKLMYLFVKVYSEETNRMNEKISKCSHTITLHALRVSDKFLLEHEKIPYEKSIALFKESDHTLSVNKKIEKICQSIGQVSQDVNDYHAKHGTLKEPIVVGADDLLPIFIYVVAKANVQDLYAKFQMISELIPEYTIKGEFGYALATLETAMNCLMSFGNGEMQEISTIDQIRNELNQFETKLDYLDDVSSVSSQEYEYSSQETTSFSTPLHQYSPSGHLPTMHQNMYRVTNQGEEEEEALGDLENGGELDLGDI
ncbi:hypothetical protein C9374_006571 [Naegleria lovaniensis]|uniref:VPS9 domain-containing protein n=1 Tax=Naegleria lovaniensis TaxID=51637 RepID=A0AA88KLZ2_NAELO|nr:uncharacterized protein C9374_006571 [Naegleria lovaniensis]KAG2379454.1 hypothetical protein C9374_006571 [Naegleria lovaniensis]